MNTEDDPVRGLLVEAYQLVNGPRDDDYGHPYQDFVRVGRIWGAILGLPDIPPETVSLMLAGLKLAREAHKPKRDNLVDLVGYALCSVMIHERNNE